MPTRAATSAVLLGLTSVAALAVVLQFGGAPAVVAGLLLTLVLPGYAMTRGLFPGRSLSRIERGTLAVTLSLAALALGGIGMFAGGARLSRLSWAELGVGVTVVSALVGYLRQRRRSDRNWSTAETTEQGAVPKHPMALSTRTALLRLAPLGLAVLLVAGAAALSWHSASRADAVAFTELSIVPAGPVAQGAAEREVVIGVICHEQQTTQYTVKVHNSEGFQSSFTPRVRNDATWTVTAKVPATGVVVAELYREGDKTPYRSVHLS
ncbi:DUF1616 domain-containing protein [Dactylosporangium matsuzakiense]|uniref:DUF1616 domain-containing protein n=1 Tax=Dactylosporangium matsuzakiense TaxID=53360 RepID=A0A9W6KKX3_9ACTN|nr:DUF1616 domain-containing protein [Dactylosporangium matsuzakiense]UWZ45956.1 DUF1616 domain-containing protein [Dactylosporangium matsuzakiense]GLL02872.1 hypothetical protein GCM10017581_046140 [Dactylosporangium matsuzakiense]